MSDPTVVSVAANDDAVRAVDEQSVGSAVDNELPVGPDGDVERPDEGNVDFNGLAPGRVERQERTTLFSSPEARNITIVVERDCGEFSVVYRWLKHGMQMEAKAHVDDRDRTGWGYRARVWDPASRPSCRH